MVARSILIADDDRLLRESISEALSDLGCIARQAGNGQEAMAMLEHARCDLLLSDIDMPDMTGFQLGAWAQAQHRTDKLVLMSARADGPLGQAARDLGAITLLSKPVQIRHITSLFHSIFD